MRSLKHIASITTFALVVPATTLAGGNEVGLTTYYFSDSGDNRVVTMALNLAKQLFTRTFVTVDFELDQVTVPAVTAVTGATRPQRRKDEPFEKSRKQVIAGIKHGLGENTMIGGNYYHSTEIDYSSNSAVLTFSQEFNNKNTTLTLRGQYLADRVGKLLDSGEIPYSTKKTYAGSAAIAQVLSPTTVMDVMYDFVMHKGFQSDPYRQVRVYDGTGAFTLADELHPHSRLRHATAGKLTHYLTRIKGSLIGSYRFYWDNWSVKSHTAEMKFNKYVLDDLVFGVNYRYYTQRGAYFYRERYAGTHYLTDGLRTADYKLKSFSSNNFGLSLTLLLRGVAARNASLGFLQNSSVEVMYFRYFNDLDFSADILQATIKFSL